MMAQQLGKAESIDSWVKLYENDIEIHAMQVVGSMKGRPVEGRRGDNLWPVAGRI